MFELIPDLSGIFSSACFTLFFLYLKKKKTHSFFHSGLIQWRKEQVLLSRATHGGFKALILRMCCITAFSVSFKGCWPAMITHCIQELGENATCQVRLFTKWPALASVIPSPRSLPGLWHGHAEITAAGLQGSDTEAETFINIRQQSTCLKIY